MPAGDFLAGVALFAATTGGAVVAAWLVVRARLLGAGRLVAAVSTWARRAGWIEQARSRRYVLLAPPVRG